MNDVPEADQQIVDAGSHEANLVTDTGTAERSLKDQARDARRIIVGRAVDPPCAAYRLRANMTIIASARLVRAVAWRTAASAHAIRASVFNHPECAKRAVGDMGGDCTTLAPGLTSASSTRASPNSPASVERSRGDAQRRLGTFGVD
jgi:hypothetical protein